MGTNMIAVLLGIAILAVLIAFGIVQKNKKAKFRQELIDKYKNPDVIEDKEVSER